MKVLGMTLALLTATVATPLLAQFPPPPPAQLPPSTPPGLGTPPTLTPPSLTPSLPSVPAPVPVQPVEPVPAQPLAQPARMCPRGPYLDCMPLVKEDVREFCRPDYVAWIKANCSVEIVY